MTSNAPEITENDLLAYVDGRLGAAEREAVAAWLSSSPADARKVETWRQQNAALLALYGQLPVSQVPQALDVHRIDERLRSQRKEWRNLAAAAVMVLAIGLAGGWFGRGVISPSLAMSEPLVAAATRAHRLYTSEVLHPVEVRADAANPQHLQRWLSKRLDRPLHVPDLTAYGLSLVGGRVLPDANNAAAQLMYQDQTGRRVTLYIVPVTGGEETGMRQAMFDRLEVLSWDDETIRCALIGDLTPEQMQAIATETYQQLS